MDAESSVADQGCNRQALVAGCAPMKVFNGVRSPNSDADRIINGHRIEINMWSL